MTTVRHKSRLVLATLAVAVLALAAACGGDSAASPTTTDGTAASQATATRAPGGEDSGTTPTTTDSTPTAQATATATSTRAPSNGPALELEGITDWINTEPLSIADLTAQGKVVLVDFWTYTCVNCLRTLPYMKDWQAKYADHGLVIIGVHSPEFEFEHVLANVQQAVKDEGVTWPVALDNDFKTWNAFGNRYWPAKYLIAPSGEVIYTHFGEGKYVETEQHIRDALTAAGNDVSGIAIGTVDNGAVDTSATSQTREIYGGYSRSYTGGYYAGNDEYYLSSDRPMEFTDPGTYKNNVFYLQGDWNNAKEAVIHARQTQNLEDYIALKMQARSANIVIQPQGTDPFKVYIFLDGNPLTADEAGQDVKFDDQGRSYITVDQPRMYSIVEQPTYKERVLKVASNSDEFAMFAFTFGTYDSGF